jgi:hypothetical protein
MRTVRSQEPETIHWPSGENATEVTLLVCPVNGPITVTPVAGFHKRTVLSEEPECSVCHARFPDEGDDVWRPGLRRRGRRSLGEVRNEGETSTGDN